MPAQPIEIISSRVFSCARDVLFDAFADPVKLVQWWGPHGFTNRVDRFDLRDGGAWHLTMTNSEGVDFNNRSTFETVRTNELVRYVHHGPIHAFAMTMSFADAEDGARLTWRMEFERTAENLALKKFIAAANEQNFDRLHAFLEATPLPG